ncbi:MAG: TraB/GumN family protein [bacterium]|nr:TraB/GumN family protein [bacterium]
MKYIYLLSTLLIFANFGCSQSNETKKEEVIRPKLEEGTKNSLLWMVTKENTQDTSFVFGTMHLIQKEYFFFPDLLKDLIKTSDKVVLEVGDDINNPLKAMALLRLEEGKSLFDFFNEKQKDSILEWAQSDLGMTEESFTTMFGQMKPFAVVSLASAEDMLSDSESYEQTIMGIQKKAEIPLEGLETLEEQMGIFDDLTDEEQATMVMDAIRGGDDADQQLEDMLRMYQSQNIDSMYLMIHDEGDVIADKESEFLTNRNLKWIPRMETLMDGKRVFFAVGAAHLGGEQGVLELLRENGYTVTSIKL